MKKTDRTENLKPFKKGADARRNTDGRPTRLTQFEKTLGVKFPPGINIKEVEALISSLMVMNPEELAAIGKNKQSPILVIIVASALAKSVKAGKTDEMLKLLERVFGKPTEKHDHTLEYIVPPPTPKTNPLADIAATTDE